VRDQVEVGRETISRYINIGGQYEACSLSRESPVHVFAAPLI